jgi:hypothetical protein
MSQNNVQEEDASSVRDEPLTSPIPLTSSRRVQKLIFTIEKLVRPKELVRPMDQANNSPRSPQAFIANVFSLTQAQRPTLAKEYADRLDTPTRLKAALE